MTGIFISLGVFFFAVIIHEFSHAFVAYRLGDETAQRMGRLTLNPIAHIDPFGTLVLPILLILLGSPVLFGWAKPVPINFSQLHNPKKDILWVGLAGPLANLLCACAASLLLSAGLRRAEAAALILEYGMVVNVVLAVFNLIPIPPLDGSRVLLSLLPLPLAIRYSQLERYGFILLFALLYLGLFDRVVWPVSLFLLSWMTKL